LKKRVAECRAVRKWRPCGYGRWRMVVVYPKFLHLRMPAVINQRVFDAGVRLFRETALRLFQGVKAQRAILISIALYSLITPINRGKLSDCRPYG
jgi:hypothetical protein